MAIRRQRTVYVVSKTQLSPNMIRMVLGGDDLHDFPCNYESGYVKLVLQRDDGKALTRSYTVRAFDSSALALTLDFVAHGDNGPAAKWARYASKGDSISIGGPGSTKLVDMSADWFFFAGDMTALPAISVNLEKLPSDAKGYAVIEIIDSADKQALKIPAGIQLHWVINPTPDQPNQVLVDAVKQQSWLDGQANVWVASEFETMRQLRRYFRQEKRIDKYQLYASSYWKMGESDEGNKRAKQMDAEA